MRFGGTRIKPSGPIPAKIMLVGEAPGRDELLPGVPFVGAAGKELRRQLAQTDIDVNQCFLTNVFMTNPEKNDIFSYCTSKTEVGKSYTFPPLAQGKYVREEFLHELTRLREEIALVNPDLIIALGNTACWALLGRTGIGKLRGAVFRDGVLGTPPVLPTYHPSAVLREWSHRVVVIQDLLKAARFVEEGGFDVPSRELWLDPTLEEMVKFRERHLKDANRICLDIETVGETITMIGFAPSPMISLTVPFFDPRKKPSQNYWPTLEEEREAYLFCKDILEGPKEKLGQNGLYDIQYLHRYGIKVRNYTHDTMILHHALFPELEKGLGFLGSIYTDEAPWKLIRKRNKDNFKLDDD